MSVSIREVGNYEGLETVREFRKGELISVNNDSAND